MDHVLSPCLYIAGSPRPATLDTTLGEGKPQGRPAVLPPLEEREGASKGQTTDGESLRHATLGGEGHYEALSGVGQPG